MVLNIAVYDAAFKKDVARLGRNEKIVRTLIAELSRSVLIAHHQTEDVGYVNRVIGAMSPMNRKVAILFFKEFSGFNWSDEEACFLKKNKKGYEKAKSAAHAALDDPHFNLWTWADRNVDVEKKPLELDKVKKYIAGVLKKAEDEGISQSAVLESIFSAGFEVDSLFVLFDKLGYDVKDGQEQA